MVEKARFARAAQRGQEVSETDATEMIPATSIVPGDFIAFANEIGYHEITHVYDNGTHVRLLSDDQAWLVKPDHKIRRLTSVPETEEE